jgi:hypothetical protein
MIVPASRIKDASAPPVDDTPEGVHVSTGDNLTAKESTAQNAA